MGRKKKISDYSLTKICPILFSPIYNKIDPKNITAINNLGKYQQEIGNEDLSITCYNKALELKPTDLRTRWLLMNTFPIVYKNFDLISADFLIIR